MNVLPVAGMSLDDLRMQEIGSEWIGRRDPVDLDTSRLGDESVPSARERRERLQGLVERSVPRGRLAEGLFLVTNGSYVALAETPDGRALVCADFLERPEAVGFPDASR
jgi:hypothetical protein